LDFLDPLIGYYSFGRGFGTGPLNWVIGRAFPVELEGAPLSKPEETEKGQASGP